MGKVTGLEDIHHVPPKVNQMYEAVMQLLEEGADVADIRVSTITERAGIGKGTAYEYFDTKEEIVACAIVYHIQRLFSWLEEKLEAQRDFRAQVTFLLDTVEQKNRCKEGFLRFVHMMTSNSGFDRMVREKMNEEAFAPYLPANIFGKILGQGVERGELRKDLPMDYMIHCVFSHLLTYMLAMASRDCFHMRETAIRPLVYQGILDELCVRGGE
nr:TetR/AcrR family transcriptional regulator [uncultured Acetatifactor sp.]